MEKMLKEISKELEKISKELKNIRKELKNIRKELEESNKLSASRVEIKKKRLNLFFFVIFLCIFQC